MVNQNLAGPVFHQSHGVTFCTIETKTNRGTRNSLFNLGVRTSEKGSLFFFFLSFIVSWIVTTLSFIMKDWGTRLCPVSTPPPLLGSRGVLYSQSQHRVYFFGHHHYPLSARCFGRDGAVGAECVGLLQPFVSICCFFSEAYTCRPPISSAEQEQQPRRAKSLSVQVWIYIRSLLKSPPWEMDSQKNWLHCNYYYFYFLFVKWSMPGLYIRAQT